MTCVGTAGDALFRPRQIHVWQEPAPRRVVLTRASRMRSTPLITLRTQGVVGREWLFSS